MFHTNRANNVAVMRGPATRRDKALSNGIYGVLVLEARAQSLIHTGSGKEKIEYDNRVIEQVVRELEKMDPDKINTQIIADLARKISTAMGGNIQAITRYGGKPVIPGTSLKGAARSRLELIFKASNNKVPSDFIKATSPPVRIKRGSSGWRHQRIWPSSTENRGRPCDATKAEYWEDINLCVTCNLFGAPGIRSRLLFGNLEPRDDVNVTEAIIRLIRRHRIINIVMEFIPSGATFTGDIGLDGISLSELGLLSIALRLHEKGKSILIGRFKYVRRPVTIDGKEGVHWFGRLNLVANELVIPKHARVSLELLRKEGIEYKEEFSSIIVEKDQLDELIERAHDEARQEYSEWLSNIDEIERLEKLWRGELE